MQYFVQGLLDVYDSGCKVDADTPIAAIKMVLAKNKLKGKIEKVAGRGNCTVTSLGQRKVTTNYKVYNIVPNVPKKKAYCLISYEYKYDKENKTFMQYFYKGSAEQFIAECKSKHRVSHVGKDKYWGRPAYSMYVDSTLLNIVEWEGVAPKQLYVLFANCVLAKAVNHSTQFGGSERVFNETLEVFGSEAKRKTTANALVKTYRKAICSHVGKPTFRKQTAHIWLYQDALDLVSTVDSGFMSNLNKDDTGPIGLYNVTFDTLKPTSASNIVFECVTKNEYWVSKDMYEHM